MAALFSSPPGTTRSGSVTPVVSSGAGLGAGTAFGLGSRLAMSDSRRSGTIARARTTLRDTMRTSMDVVSDTKDTIVSATSFLFSPTALKAYLRLYIYAVVSASLLAVAAWIYWLFYSHYMPSLVHSKAVHFQLRSPSWTNSDGTPSSSILDSQPAFDFTSPYGIVDITGANMFNDQKYSMMLNLHMPTSPSNNELGNFMVDFAIYGKNPKSSRTLSTNTQPKPQAQSEITLVDLSNMDILAQASRPAMMTYKSVWIDTAQKLVALPLYLTGWLRESEKVKVPIVQDFKFTDWSKPPSAISLRLNSLAPLQIYGADVEIVAQLEGLRYAMYHYFITTALCFTIALWSMGLSAFLASTLVLSAAFAARSTGVDTADLHHGYKVHPGRRDTRVTSDGTLTTPTLSIVSPESDDGSQAALQLEREQKEAASQRIPIKEQSINVGGSSAGSSTGFQQHSNRQQENEARDESGQQRSRRRLPRIPK